MSYDLPLNAELIAEHFNTLATSCARKYGMDFSDCLFASYDSLARSVMDYDASRGGWEAFYMTYARFAIRKHFARFRTAVTVNAYAAAQGYIGPRLGEEETAAILSALAADSGDSAEQDDTALARLDALRAALATLGEADRALILRYYDRGATLESIGADSGKSRQNVHYALSKAVKKLKCRIAEIMATRVLSERVPF